MDASSSQWDTCERAPLSNTLFSFHSLLFLPLLPEGKLLTLAQIRDGYEHKKGQGPADSLLE